MLGIHSDTFLTKLKFAPILTVVQENRQVNDDDDDECRFFKCQEIF